MGLNVRSDTFGTEAGIGRASGPLGSGVGIRGAAPHAGMGRASGAFCGEREGWWLRREGMEVSILLVLCCFEKWVVLGAADHLVERCSGGDHRVDAIFFFYLEVD
jgi:hypothetical protein